MYLFRTPAENIVQHRVVVFVLCVLQFCSTTVIMALLNYCSIWSCWHSSITTPVTCWTFPHKELMTCCLSFTQKLMDVQLWSVSMLQLLWCLGRIYLRDFTKSSRLSGIKHVTIVVYIFPHSVSHLKWKNMKHRGAYLVLSAKFGRVWFWFIVDVCPSKAISVSSLMSALNQHISPHCMKQSSVLVAQVLSPCFKR